MKKAVENFFDLNESCCLKKDVAGILSILADNVR